MRVWNATPAGQACRFAQRLRWKYGLSVEQYDAMLIEQEGLCAICRQPPDGSSHGKLVVDHSHTTGKVRQLLCGKCNKAIGLMQDNPELLELAAAYLRDNL